VVPRPGATLDEDEIRKFALENGPVYAHPRRVFFIDVLPLAGTNKIDRKGLMARAAEAARTEGTA
jgi:acyl-CoA synthetase (AMP-forming)/AMP-acid ligase II